MLWRKPLCRLGDILRKVKHLHLSLGMIFAIANKAKISQDVLRSSISCNKPETLINSYQDTIEGVEMMHKFFSASISKCGEEIMDGFLMHNLMSKVNFCFLLLKCSWNAKLFHFRKLLKTIVNSLILIRHLLYNFLRRVSKSI